MAMIRPGATESFFRFILQNVGSARGIVNSREREYDILQMVRVANGPAGRLQCEPSVI